MGGKQASCVQKGSVVKNKLFVCYVASLACRLTHSVRKMTTFAMTTLVVTALKQGCPNDHRDASADLNVGEASLQES